MKHTKEGINVQLVSLSVFLCSALGGQNLNNKMRKDWDLRAKEVPKRYVVSCGDWKEFEESGKLDALRMLSGLNDSSSMIALDIGCGIGRMDKYLARYFLEVHGIDVSLEMIKRAKQRLQSYENVFLYLGSGYDLGLFRDDVFDFVCSYITFQHIPRRIVHKYFSECYRVLKKGGVFKFQMLGLRIPIAIYTWMRRLKNFKFNIPCEPRDDDTWSIRFYSTEELVLALHATGFINIKLACRPASTFSVASVIWLTCQK